ncbi:AKR_collapsed_G0005660.mRNA.1.CDS.1 [Saccharomyces cerevisiae]|nr:AKR_collapsed_G0005660.mRNA.1.CDS.1 [Saccharomyces cerevisiae]
MATPRLSNHMPSDSDGEQNPNFTPSLGEFPSPQLNLAPLSPAYHHPPTGSCNKSVVSRFPTAGLPYHERGQIAFLPSVAEVCSAYDLGDGAAYKATKTIWARSSVNSTANPVGVTK